MKSPALLPLALLCALPSLARAELPKDALVVISRGGCENCAAYRLLISEDGKVTFSPHMGHMSGTKTKQLSEGELNVIKDQVTDLKETFPKGASYKKPMLSGMGVVTIEYRYDGKAQTVTYHVTDGSAPKIVEHFLERMERLSGVDAWMAGDSPERTKKRKHGSE